MRTPLSSGLAAASLGLLVAGLAFRSWQVVLLALPPVIVLALGSLFPPARPRLVAVRTLSRDRAEAGRDVDVKLVVRNDGPTLDLVEIVDVLPREFETIHGTNHAVVSLERGGTMPLSYTVRSPVKGDFRIGPVRVRSLDPLALGAEDAVLPTDARLVVAPTMEDLRRTKLQPRRTRPWFGQVSSRQLGEGTDFWGVREYTAGDEVRRINWKASARLGVAVRVRRMGPRSILPAGLPHRPDFAPPGSGGAERGDRDGGSRIRRRDRFAVAARHRVEARRTAAGGPDRSPNPAHGARQPDLAAAARRASHRLGPGDPVGARPQEDRHMASTQLIPSALRAAPVVTLALLVGWAILDVSAIGDGRWAAALLAILGIGVAAVILSVVLRWRGIRPIGLIAIGAAYVGVHAFVLGVQLVPALVFLSVLISQVELRILAERFAPLYEAGLRPEVRGRLGAALGRPVLRLIIAAALSVVVPILAADLAVAGIVPATTIPTAIALAGALVAVVALLALMPSLSRRAT